MVASFRCVEPGVAVESGLALTLAHHRISQWFEIQLSDQWNPCAEDEEDPVMIHRMLAWLAVSFYRQLLELFHLMMKNLLK